MIKTDGSNMDKEIIRATLFVAGDGVEKEILKEKLELSDKVFNDIINELKDEFGEYCGIRLIEYKNKLQLCSNSELAEDIACILNPIRERALTKAALETVAIIAYKQPVTKLEIEEIRNVNSADYALQALLQHKMIEVVGRKDAVGKPLLFGTTEEFLKRFCLSDIKDLPNYDSLMERIRLIREENNILQNTDSLYRDFELQDKSQIIPDEEEIPEFLEGEEVQTIKGEDFEDFEENDDIEDLLNEMNDRNQRNNLKNSNDLGKNNIDANKSSDTNLENTSESYEDEDEDDDIEEIIDLARRGRM